MSLFRGLQFLTTVNDLRSLPNEGLEVAFAGRSNAGKSSAINTLANHTRLAFVSKTPGRTQHINYFDFGQERRLVDLPGYGYAEVPAAVRAHWEKLLGLYLVNRSNLIGLVLIMDSRRPLTQLDCQMLDWFLPTGKPVHCLLTKSDKLSKQDSIKVLREVKKQFAELPQVTVQLFSSLKKQGVEETETIVGQWFAQALAAQAEQFMDDPDHEASIQDTDER
ncbi:ribosome biogenesis GTP-binding protein YihA/YsxC [Chitinilyticum piscinae]|uniref:Probable GTP-binding protein EngB n=1 Tax=Chitinilyticum piscinae TaxID=2866724 RepID=A0A8J7FIH3_9NEIS|nr:ribosome biogenesis GTP-binding protein YihA/YsxC [Chitinilyticum piscinae]MBE9608022.1 YihA family ribosome biogenesis GTP-binding protein [Chitinilyticum piscinae]